MNGFEVSLHVADYLVMGMYMAGLIAMGIYYRRFAQIDLEHYFLAGRKFKGWMSGTSYAVTSMNADVAPAYCGMTVITGVWIYWWYFSRFGLALMIGGINRKLGAMVVVAFQWRSPTDRIVRRPGHFSAE